MDTIFGQPLGSFSPEDLQKEILREIRRWGWVSSEVIPESIKYRFEGIERRLSVLRYAIDKCIDAIVQRDHRKDPLESAAKLGVAEDLVLAYVGDLGREDIRGLVFDRMARDYPARALEALSAFLEKKPPLPYELWHYTSACRLLAIAKSRELWAMRSTTLNDTTESVWVRDLMEKTAFPCKGIVHKWDLLSALNYEAIGSDTWDTLRREPPMQLRAHIMKAIDDMGQKTYRYTTSFCDAENLLSQWRGYGTDEPVAICFNGVVLNRMVAEQGARLSPCVYESLEQDRLMVNAARREIQSIYRLYYHEKNSYSKEQFEAHSLELADRVAKELMPLAPVLKHPAFSEEREWRIIYEGGAVKDKERFRLLQPEREYDPQDPPRDLIKKIMVGPCHDQNSLRDRLEAELPRIWPKMSPIVVSDTPYRPTARK